MLRYLLTIIWQRMGKEVARCFGEGNKFVMKAMFWTKIQKK